AVERVAWEPSGKEIRIWNSGQTWPLFDLGTESVAHYGFPYMMFHRADMQDLLAAAVCVVKPDAIHLNARCVGLDQDGAGVTLNFEDGTRARGDVAIGADGIHSAIRQSLFGADEPRFTGIMAWRGVIDVNDLPDGMLRPIGTNWVGPGGHVVHYFLRRGALVNFFGARERDDWQVESYSAVGTVEECLADYVGWHDNIQTLIKNIKRPLKWALMDREPMDKWSLGRATLLGDACHPMLPFLAQGAVMAIEDGLIIARCLDAHDDPESAVAAYEAVRIERTAQAMQGSSDNAKRFHNNSLADPEAAQKFVDGQWDTELIKQRYDWLFTYDATTVAV
ncbi:MAG: FAD-dependent monooxygenase, partial [Alphaproteobacteria bacterium]